MFYPRDNYGFSVPAVLCSTNRWLLCFLFLFSMMASKAAVSEVRWSVSPMLGVHSPNMKLINDQVFQSRLPVAGELLFQNDDGARAVRYDVINSLPKIKYGTEVGIEFRMELDQRNHLVIGLGSWEATSRSLVRTTLPFQGRLTDTTYERSASISYLQYYIGWRRDLVKKHKKYNLYTRVLLHEVFDIDFRESFVFEFTDAADGVTQFKRIAKIGSQATGYLMLQPAIGGEFFMREWLSLGVDLGYTYGLNKFELGNVEFNSDFQGQDSLTIRYPTGAVAGSNKRGYLSDGNDGGYNKMELDFNGWRALFKINFYY